MTRIKCSKCEFINPEGQVLCLRCGAGLPLVRSRDDEVQRGGQLDSGGDTVFRPGQQVAGRYTVHEVIGRGGMGCIYRVRDNTLGEEVALKTLLPEFLQNQLVVERFFNEARITRHLSHPNIVRVHDIGRADDAVYISMELLQGKSLRQLLDELPTGKYLPLDTTLRIVEDLCAALEYAHQFTIHRDIKPENIMICPDGSVKLMDFGISKLKAHTQLTAASVVMGTPLYMSPEQLKNSRDVDGRADVFSVGVLLYETLTGNVPTGVPKSVSQLRPEAPSELDTIIGTCVEPNREQRYGTVTELRDALLNTRLSLSNVKPTLMTPMQSAATNERSRLLRRLMGVGLIVSVLASAAWGLWRIETVPFEAESIGLSGETVAAEDPSAAEFAYAARLAAHAQEKIGSIPEGDGARQQVAMWATSFWEQAVAKKEERILDALRLGRAALQCYAAALSEWPAGMVFIPPGELNPHGEGLSDAVWVDAFYIDKTEVTLGAYRRFCEEASWRDNRAVRDETAQDNLPVTWVTYYDAQAYAAHVQKRLPAEAQWTRAAYGREGDSGIYPWGRVWEEGCANVSAEGDGYADLAPVGQFVRDCTSFGCLDMTGNAMEWTRSPYDLNAPANAIENNHEGDLSFGVLVALRGGRCGLEAHPLSERFSALYEASYADVGIRCVVQMPITFEAIEALL